MSILINAEQSKKNVEVGETNLKAINDKEPKM